MSRHYFTARSLFGARVASVLVASVLVASALGCKEKAELEFSEYGETIDHLPVIEDLPRAFPIADELESRECHIREEAEEHAHRNLLISQGREQTLRLEEEQRLEKERQERELEKAAKQKALEEAAAEKAAAEESAVEEPAAEEPASEEPAAEEPAAEEPAVEEPAAEEPAE